MREIQERKEAYWVHGSPVIWRDGALRYPLENNGEFATSSWHKDFMAGEIFVFDPLTSEFVCPPKPERPCDLTAGEMWRRQEDA